MGCPTVKAMAAFKHLAAYFKNTMDYKVMLYKCGPGDVLMDHLSQFCHVDSESLKRSRSDFDWKYIAIQIGLDAMLHVKAQHLSWFFFVGI